jgi:hypothetical protein
VYLEPVELPPCPNILGNVSRVPPEIRFRIKIPLVLLHHMSTLLKEKDLPHFPILDLDFKLTWEEVEISNLQWILVKVWSLGDRNSGISLEEFQNLSIEPPSNLEIHHSNTQITDFTSFSKTSSCAFLNGKVSPWVDSGIKLRIMNNDLNTFEDYVYILLHYDKTEFLKDERNKVYKGDIDKFMKEKVLLYLITDGDKVVDEEYLCSKYPNIQCITRGQYASRFSQLFETLRALKSDLVQTK